MSGSVYLTAVVLVIGVALAVFASPLFLIPVVVVVLTVLFGAPLLLLLRGGEGPRGGSGVPSTQDASYEPVQDPAERGL